MKTKVFHSIREVPREQWNQLLNERSCTYSHEFWEVIEQSELNDFSYSHVLFYDNTDNPVALASFYSITTDIAIFAPAGLRSLLLRIRHFFPNFLKFKMLECGTPITINKPFVTLNSNASKEIINSLHEVLLQTARREGAFLIVLRDFEPESYGLLPDFKKLGYHFVDSLPTTYMEVPWATPDDYISSMKSYFRSKLLKHLRINRKQDIRHEVLENFDDLADVLCAQWQVVHENAAEYQREVLTPEFYREFSTKLGDRSKAILFYQKDELVGHALLLKDGDMLRWLYVGRNTAANDSLYIYVAYSVVETAILTGAKRLELGLTTYSIKKDIGAFMSPIKLALRSPWALINPFIGLGYAILNHTPEIRNKNIFKS